jgi:hypothetical protein
MPYIMVPVPEEHVAEVMEHVVRLSARANLQQWDTDAVAELFLAADEASKSVLSAVARRTIAGSPVTDEALATLVELGRREILGVIREINLRAARGKRPQLMIVREVSEPTPDGRTSEKRVLGMSIEIAEMIRKAEEIERTVAPHPLQRGTG